MPTTPEVIPVIPYCMGNIPNGIPIDLITKGNRIKVDNTNRLIGQKNVYAIGDIAYMGNDNFPTGHPQVANVAISQAKNLANNLSLSLKDKPFTPFIYKSPGSMATVGKHKAIVDLPNFSFQGRIAWYIWMFLHLMLILSVRNKFFIFINWKNPSLIKSIRQILKSPQLLSSSISICHIKLTSWIQD
jgi:NADH dehydrogenase